MRLDACGWLLLLSACATTPWREAPVRIAAPVVARLVDDVPVPVIEVELSGHPGQRFLVDSGAQTTVLRTARARDLGVPIGRVRGRMTASGSSGARVAIEEFAIIDELRVGELAVADWRTVAFDPPLLELLDLTGILGQDLLRQLVVVIDAERRQVHFLPGTFDNDAIVDYLSTAGLGSGAWRRIDAEFRPSPFIRMSVAGNEPRELEMKVDTGATGTSIPAFAIDALRLEPSGTTESIGVSGVYAAPTYLLEGLGFFGFTLDLSIHRTPLAYGLLGMNVLREFVVVLDGPNDALWIHRR